MRKTKHLLPYNPATADRRSRARIEEVANARTLENATVGRGGLNFVDDGVARVYDADGNIVMLVGALGDDEYGIAGIKPDGTRVKFSTLAFDEASQVLLNSGNTASLDSWQDLVYSGTDPGVGPVVDGIEIGSARKARITLTSTISCVPGAATGCSGFMGVLVEGPTTIQPIEDKSSYVSLAVGSATVSISLRSSATFVLKDLQPGTYTFTAKYLSRVANAGFGHREVIVQPY